MADIQDMGRYAAGGYSFYTERDAALAESELRKVQYLEARLDYTKPQSILRIYNKVIEDRMLKSPVGHHFLKKIQEFLYECPEINPEAVSPIPLYVSYEGEFREQAAPARARVMPAVRSKNSSALTISIVLNIGLAIAVIAMFIIALNADQPNILNYERQLINRYAGWEQELTERERAVREKEREIEVWKD